MYIHWLNEYVRKCDKNDHYEHRNQMNGEEYPYKSAVNLVCSEYSPSHQYTPYTYTNASVRYKSMSTTKTMANDKNDLTMIIPQRKR